MAKTTARTRQKAPSTRLPKAPEPYRESVTRGPLDPRTRRLVKIAASMASMGAMREGSVRSGVRKAVAEGIPLEQIEQLVPLVAGTIGLPSAVACWSWLRNAAGRD
jgi:alkylhydroperoxidase/carboxymuconolactone decarboxylase family protein YurZ